MLKGLGASMTIFRTIIALIACASAAVALAQTPANEQSEAVLGGVSYEAYKLEAENRPVEAERVYRYVYAGYLAKLGEFDPKTIDTLSAIARTLETQKKLDAAETTFLRVLELETARFGANSEQAAKTMDRLGTIALAKGDREAEISWTLKAVAADMAARGENSVEMESRYFGLALYYEQTFDRGRAEHYYRKRIDIMRAREGPESESATLWTIYLLDYLDQVSTEELRRQLRAKLAETVRARIAREGKEGTALAFDLLTLGHLEYFLHDFSQAEATYRGALDASFGHNGPRHPYVADAYGRMADMLALQGKRDEAATNFQRAIETWVLIHGPNHATVADAYVAAARNHEAQGKLVDARTEAFEALSRLEASVAPSSGNIALKLWPLAEIDEKLGYLADAEKLWRRSVAIGEGTDGPFQLTAAVSYVGLARNLVRQGRAAEAEVYAGKAVVGERFRNANAGAGTSTRLNPFHAEASDAATYLDIVLSNQATGSKLSQQVQDNLFMAAQDQTISSSAYALADAYSRNLAKSAPLAAVLREQQDGRVALGAIDARQLAAIASGDAAASARLRIEVEAARARLQALDARIDREFPQYRKIASPLPASLSAVRARLRSNEGVVVLVIGFDKVFAVGVSRDKFAVNRVDNAGKTVLPDIEDLRCNLDEENCSEAAVARISALPQTKHERLGDRRYDLAVASRLYERLLAPLARELVGVDTLFVTTSARLSDVPLSALVTAPPKSGEDFADPDVLGAAPWLAERYALVSLPSITALAVVPFRGTLRGGEQFRGYGDPALAMAKPSALPPAAVPAARSLHPRKRATPQYFRSVNSDGLRFGDVELLRQLPSLPGTRDELAAMAGLFSVADQALVTGTRATEAAFRSDPKVSKARILAIATHGLLPMPELGMAEPGLVFTPPTLPTKADDGVLTASEVAGLSFEADLAILSACNTASTASDAGGGDSLSGLSRGFLYAGVQALLASRWRVSDDATAVLTVETLRLRRGPSGMSRAAALKGAMRTVRTGRRPDGSAIGAWAREWQHPAYWAAFSLIAIDDR